MQKGTWNADEFTPARHPVLLNSTDCKVAQLSAFCALLTLVDRVELVDGEIIQMSPIGNRHLACVNRATRRFILALGEGVVVSVQNPLRLSNYTEPQPDIVLLRSRPDQYASKTPAAEDAILVVEVADTTFAYDRDVKLPRYAMAGVPEVWMANNR